MAEFRPKRAGRVERDEQGDDFSGSTGKDATPRPVHLAGKFR